MCNMSAFLSMFDGGFTSRRVLMPYRCKSCFRYFHHFHRLRTHQGIHKQSYVKHLCRISLQNVKVIKQGTGSSPSQYSYNGNNHSQNSEYSCNHHSAIEDDKRTVVLNIPLTGIHNRDNLCNYTYPISLLISDGTSSPSTNFNHVNDKAHTKGPQGVTTIKHEINLDSDMQMECERDLSKCNSSSSKVSKLNPSNYNFKMSTPYRCIYCSKSFSKSSNRLIHQRAHLKDPYPWVCKQCPKKLKSRGALAVHTRVHTGEKPYQCQYCKGCFSTKGYLNVHVRGHTGELPYRCEFCSKSFRESCKLTVHRRTHTLEKPYGCRFCEATFSQRGNARKHERIHTGEKPFKCCHCDKEYTNFRNFKRHEGVHTGVSAYKCSKCALSFKFRRSLRTHEKTHTGGTVFVCIQCKGTFSSPSNLRRHKKDVHYSKPSEEV